MMRCFSDSHAHIQHLVHGIGASTTVVTSARALPHRLVLCGTHPSIDWPLIASLADQPQHRTPIPLSLGGDRPLWTPEAPSSSSSSPSASALTTTTAPPQRLVYGFGVHPWFVETPARSSRGGSDAAGEPSCSCATTTASADATHTAEMSLEDILTSLEAHLQKYPHAIVGEIGLDKLRGPPEALQIAAFLGQMRLAARYGRPVSVHCVRHHGLLLQLLQDLPAEDTPPAIVLHGFTGSLEVVKSLLKLKNKKWATAPSEASLAQPHARPPPPVKIKDRVFFGVGASTSFRVKAFKSDIFPLLLNERRALLETDEHYMCASHQDGAAVTHETATGALEADGNAADAIIIPESALAGLEEVAAEAEQIQAGACGAMEAAFDAAFASVV